MEKELKESFDPLEAPRFTFIAAGTKILLQHNNRFRTKKELIKLLRIGLSVTKPHAKVIFKELRIRGRFLPKTRVEYKLLG